MPFAVIILGYFMMSASGRVAYVDGVAFSIRYWPMMVVEAVEAAATTPICAAA